MPRSLAVTPDLSGKRILFAVPPARFDEAQLYQTWQILSEMNAWLTLGCDSPTGVAVGEHGSVERISRALAEADPSRFDAVIVVSGDWGGAEKRTLSRFAKARLPIAAFRGVRVKAGVVFAGNIERFLAELAVAIAKRPRAPAHTPAHA